MLYYGIGASQGIGIGRIVVIEETELIVEKKTITDVEAEIARFNSTLADFISNTKKLSDDMAASIGEHEAEILLGQIMMMEDPEMVGQITAAIESEKINAEVALESVCDMFIDMFSAMDDDLIQQRAADLRDIKTRMLKLFLNIKDTDVSKLPQDTILVAYDLTPSVTAGIDAEKVTGILTQVGGKTSHSAILARALEIPAVVCVPNITELVKDGDLVVVNGNKGRVILNPDEDILAESRALQKKFLEEKKALQKFKGVPTVTKDGKGIELVANIGSPDDVERVIEHDAEGIGLFRTEFLFMGTDSMPTEEQQFSAYKKVAVAMAGKPVIIRTLDIGGDKEIAYMGLEKEDNPFLGYRAIRYCLARKDVYTIQLRSLLRASAFGKIKIMIPLVTGMEELREAKALIKDIMGELDVKNIPYNKDIEIGVMIETPAASLVSDLLAKEADFFSIGTNDLTQYTMAVDRGNGKVAYLYSTFNPAVLRSIKNVIQAANRENIMVGMCGEAAGDPMMIPLLLAFGLDEFSMTSSSILASRKLINNYSVEELQKVADNVMSLSTAREVEEYMNKFVSIDA